MRTGINRKARNFLFDAAREGVKKLQAFNHIIEQLNPYRELIVFGRKNIDGVTAHAKHAPLKIHFIAVILHRN